jgi:hypothetical protein
MIPIDDLGHQEKPVWTKLANADVVECVAFFDHHNKLRVILKNHKDGLKFGDFLLTPELFTFYATEEKCVNSPEPFYTEMQINMIVPAKMKKEDLEAFMLKHPLSKQMGIIIKDEKEIYENE